MLKYLEAEKNELKTGDIDLVMNHEESKYFVNAQKFYKRFLDLHLKKYKPSYTNTSKDKLLVCFLSLYCNLKERDAKCQSAKLRRGFKREKDEHKVNPRLHIHLNYQFYHRKGESYGRKHPFFEANMAKYQWSYRRVREFKDILVRYNIVQKFLVNNSRKDADKLRDKTTVIKLNSMNQWDIRALLDLGMTFNDLLLVSKSGWDLSEEGLVFDTDYSDEILVTLKQGDEKKVLSREEFSSCLVAENTLKELEKFNSIFRSKLRSKEEYELFRYSKIAFSNRLPEWGRFYSSYISIEKVLKRMYLKENYLIELDRKASVFNLLYLYVTGAKYKDDPYLQFTENTLALINKGYLLKDPQMVKVIRDIFKKLIMYFLNTDSPRSLASSLRHQLLSFGLCSEEIFKRNKSFLSDHIDWPDSESLTQLDLIFNELGNKYPQELLAFTQKELRPINIHQLKETYFKTFPELKPYLFKPGVFNTMIMIESQITLDLLKIMMARDILPISIHDAVYVPVDMHEEFQRIQEEVIEKNMNDFKLKQGKYSLS